MTTTTRPRTWVDLYRIRREAVMAAKTYPVKRRDGTTVRVTVPEDDHETERRLEAFDLMREALRLVEWVPHVTDTYEGRMCHACGVKRMPGNDHAPGCSTALALAAADKAARGEP